MVKSSARLILTEGPFHIFGVQLFQLGKEHPDPSRANLYAAFFELIFKEEHPKLIELLSPFVLAMPKREYQHFLNLLSHTHIAEYRFLIENFMLDGDTLSQETGIHYSKFTVEHWKTAIALLLEDPSVIAATEEELTTKRTQTFVFQRYLGAQLILRHLFQDKPITIVDGGCSLGIATECMSSSQLNSFFQDPDDEIDLSSVGLTYKLQITIKRAYKLDKELLDQEWILACSFYPNESITEALRLQEMMATIKRQPPQYPVTEVRGDKGDITQLTQAIPDDKVDAIIVNTTLYQLSKTETAQFFSTAQKVLTENGVIIITDFAHIKDGNLEFGEHWFSNKENKYRTFAIFNSPHGLREPLEIFQFPNARCKKIVKGKDFHLLFAER